MKWRKVKGRKLNLKEYYRYINLANNWSDSPEERNVKLVEQKWQLLFPCYFNLGLYMV